jgi:hypothetical protein
MPHATRKGETCSEQQGQVGSGIGREPTLVDSLFDTSRPGRQPAGSPSACRKRGRRDFAMTRQAPARSRCRYDRRQRGPGLGRCHRGDSRQIHKRGSAFRGRRWPCRRWRRQTPPRRSARTVCLLRRCSPAVRARAPGAELPAGLDYLPVARGVWASGLVLRRRRLYEFRQNREKTQGIDISHVCCELRNRPRAVGMLRIFSRAARPPPLGTWPPASHILPSDVVSVR